MPNYCHNELTISHTDAKMMARVAKGFNKGRLLQELIPCPKELVKGNSPCKDKAIAKANKEKYGYEDWYDWRVANWGTKWDIIKWDDKQKVKADSLMVLSFDTAWAPPFAAYEKLEAMGFTITGYYYEPGVQFCGVWVNGHDCEYVFPETIEDAKAMPKEFNDAFAIVENMELDEAEAA